MIRYFTRDKRRLVELSDPEPGCWINLSPPFGPEELESFARHHAFDTIFLTDSLDLDERARYERDEDVRFILINTPVANSKDAGENEAVFITVPVGILLTIEHIITISAVETPVMQAFLNGRVKAIDPTDEKKFVLQILEQNVALFLSALKQLNMRRNRIEMELMNSSRNSELKQLLSIEKSLVYFVNSLNANELLKMKMKRTDFLHINGDEDLQDLFENIIIDNSQALSMANVYTNILNGTMDAYSSIISNNLNVVIHRLTVLTVVLAVPTLISSLFGMNIPNGIPESPWFFYGTIVVITVITGLMYNVIQKRRLF